jgi:hypothetical protein
MNRRYLVVILMVSLAALLARSGVSQNQGASGSQAYQPAVPPPSVGYYGGNSGWGGGGGGTVAGSTMTGFANAISAAGSRNLSNSAAAVNMTQAQRNEIQNRQLGQTTWYEMRAANDAYRKSQEGPPATMAQITRIAQEYAPKPLSANQVNPVTGEVKWPAWLQLDCYAAQRTELQQLLQKKATYGSLNITEQLQARTIIGDMFETLKSQVQQAPAQDYINAKNFLRSADRALSQSDLQL